MFATPCSVDPGVRSVAAAAAWLSLVVANVAADPRGPAVEHDEATPAYASPEASREERFARPPSENRILPIWHDVARRSDADEVIRGLLAKGFGGLVANMPFDPATYLRDPGQWANLEAILRAGKRAGLTFWLYDELGYPSGTAGGMTMEGHPEWQSEALLVVEAGTTGDPVELKLPPGELVLAAAYPAPSTGLDVAGRVDLSAQVEDGVLRWTPPAGDWHVMAVGRDRIHDGAHVSVALADRTRAYINLLMAEPTARFCQVTHEAYAANLGGDLSRYFTATFTDEPSLQTLWFKEMPYKPLPWSPGFAGEFQRRRGYALEPLLPLLVAGAGGPAAKVRHDYWTTVGELVAQNYFGVIDRVSRRHGIPSGGHLLLEESLACHVPLYGDFFRCIRQLSAPSMDCLTSIPDQVPWQVARLLASAAELDGERETMCEQSDHSQRYRPPGDNRPVYQVSLDQIRGSINRLMLGGIHVITSYYDFSPFAADGLRDLNAFVGRCSTLLKGGRQVADIAVLYPSDTLCASFVPSRRWADDAVETRAVERVFSRVSDVLFQACRDFTYVDAQALAASRLEPGSLRHGELSWQAVVLPKVDTLPLACWRTLADFWRGGGLVIAVGAIPVNSESDFPSAEVQALADELFPQREGPRICRNPGGGAAVYLPEGQEFLLPNFLDQLLEPDVRPYGEDAPIRATHRRVDGLDVYLIANDSDRAWTGTVHLCGAGPGTVWDPGAGTRTPLDGAQPMRVALAPYDAVLATFETARPRRRVDGELSLDPIRTSPFPRVTPEWTKGEFVEASLAPDPRHGTPERPAWRVAGTLTRGDTDTFLFAVFPSPPRDVSEATGLELRLWAPEDGKSPAQCFVMLGDAAGHTWATNLDRKLSDFRELRLLIPFSQLTRAEFAPQPEGDFDFTRVTRVVVGWGGYFGREGEQLEYTVALPALFGLHPER